MTNLENFVIGQAGNSIATYIEIMGEAAFMNEIRKCRKQIPLKYQQLIGEYERFIEQRKKKEGGREG